MFLRRIAVTIAASSLFVVAHAVSATGHAEPAVTLPPMTSTDAGPIIGGGDSALERRISEQLVSFDTPEVEEVDGSDAAQFIAAAADVADRELASVFLLLQRALGCQQKAGAGFGARAYRRTDGRWGGAMLVIAESAVPDVDALTACITSGWRRATAGAPNSMCNNGWSYPPFANTRRGEQSYFVLLAGTASDFCSVPNANYRNKARSWPR
ncbi:hypothetical protein [Mycobacterium sp.]|uniref:hypothetical protein n=1 Tax=Mycobacterium sp. TaxID=1785 RepID=UPI003BAC49F2